MALSCLHNGRLLALMRKHLILLSFKQVSRDCELSQYGVLLLILAFIKVIANASRVMNNKARIDDRIAHRQT